MTLVRAYAASKVGGTLEPFEYELGPIDSYDVDIAVEHCGICHSDLSMLQNDWGMTTYPYLPRQWAVRQRSPKCLILRHDTT